MLPLRPLLGEEGNENQRAQERAEDGTEQDERYAPSSALGRVHVSRRDAREHHRSDCSTKQGKSENHRHHGDQRGPEAGKQAAQHSKTEPSREYGNPSETIHRPASRESGEGSRTQENGRPQTHEPFEAANGCESDRTHCRCELDPSVERRHSDREQQSVAGYGQLCRNGTQGSPPKLSAPVHCTSFYAQLPPPALPATGCRRVGQKASISEKDHRYLPPGPATP